MFLLKKVKQSKKLLRCSKATAESFSNSKEIPISLNKFPTCSNSHLLKQGTSCKEIPFQSQFFESGNLISEPNEFLNKFNPKESLNSERFIKNKNITKLNSKHFSANSMQNLGCSVNPLKDNFVSQIPVEHNLSSKRIAIGSHRTDTRQNSVTSKQVFLGSKQISLSNRLNSTEILLNSSSFQSELIKPQSHFDSSNQIETSLTHLPSLAKYQTSSKQFLASLRHFPTRSSQQNLYPRSTNRIASFKTTLGRLKEFSTHSIKKVSESEMSLRGELEIVQRALKMQTRRCRQLVTEYTRRLQEKEQQYQSEKLLRDSQLAKVLRALLIFEARLKQEQKFISHQLKEKDYIIEKQRDDLSRQFCKHCNQFTLTVRNTQESLDSSSEYVATDYQDYQSSNFESLDSSSETYATISVKEVDKPEDGKLFLKNKSKDNFSKRTRKIAHRKSVGTYFEVLKLRKDNTSPSSNDDNTSNDYENLESLPAESISDRISVVSESIENIFAQNETFTENNIEKHDRCENENNLNEEIQEDHTKSKISETIPIFDADGETNDNWYASASDQEDDEQRDVYRNNPVLECMNQILMQNINDINSPPKTPNVERRQIKRVKFSDEEEKTNKTETTHNYYETPVQKLPNFYETPQSIYSNDYEQISTKTTLEMKPINPPKESHYYVDMEKSEQEEILNRKPKINRVPPALPPKPANLLSKYKIQQTTKNPIKSSTPSIESEPDYCSISELNLPTNKTKKLNVVAEINIPESIKVSEKHVILHSPQSPKQKTLVTPKLIEKNIQMAKQTEISPVKIQKSSPLVPTVLISPLVSPTKIKIKVEEIPKLPQVSEILIPDENDSGEERINYDNYVLNTTQTSMKSKRVSDGKKPIFMGSSVSSLITGFNNQHLISEINKTGQIPRLNKKLFTNFEQNSDKPSKSGNVGSVLNLSATATIPETFECFDLSQNFEEFKLDDCEIEEYNIVGVGDTEVISNANETQHISTIKEHVLPDILAPITNPTRVELVRATNDVIIPQLNTNSVNQLKMKLEMEKDKDIYNQTERNEVEPSYEHFLECTGLSSKSILTPSRLLSNHKSMLKPKDVKLRSKVKANVIERQGNTIKYWSEPFL